MSGQADVSIDSAVLLRFISNEAPAGECLVVERWMDADPAHRSEVELLERAWALSARPPKAEGDTRSLWLRIEQQLEHSDGRIRRSTTARSQRTAGPRLALIRPSPRSWWSSAPARAAAAAVVVAAGIAVVSHRAPEPRVSSSPPPMRTIATQRGERAELQLADGTKVKLNAASTLRIPGSFGEGSRDLYLDGAAYFEVTHDTARVFRVHTAHGVTEDLGTSFVISAYATDSTEQVAVADGAVELHGTVGEPVALEAGDVGHVSAAGVVSVARHVALDRYFSWIDGVLEFDNAALGDAVPILERQYDIEIHLEDSSLAKKRFTASFTAGDVDQLMNGLAFLLDARYERPGGGRVLTLTPR